MLNACDCTATPSSPVSASRPTIEYVTAPPYLVMPSATVVGTGCLGGRTPHRTFSYEGTRASSCAPRSSRPIRRVRAASARSPPTSAAALLGVDGIDRVEKVVIVNEPSRPQRPGLVATIAQGVRGDYVRAARILGRLDVDVVLLQHEYGIFGGRDGEYVASLTEELAQPLVVTLHTVLSEPTPHQAKVLAGRVPAGAARDRDDRHGARPARRRRRVPGARRCGSCPTARRA